MKFSKDLQSVLIKKIDARQKLIVRSLDGSAEFEVTMRPNQDFNMSLTDIVESIMECYGSSFETFKIEVYNSAGVKSEAASMSVPVVYSKIRPLGDILKWAESNFLTNFECVDVPCWESSFSMPTIPLPDAELKASAEYEVNGIYKTELIPVSISDNVMSVDLSKLSRPASVIVRHGRRRLLLLCMDENMTNRFQWFRYRNNFNVESWLCVEATSETVTDDDSVLVSIEGGKAKKVQGSIVREIKFNCENVDVDTYNQILEMSRSWEAAMKINPEEASEIVVTEVSGSVSDSQAQPGSCQFTVKFR